MQWNRVAKTLPAGGIHRGARSLEAWRWNGRASLCTVPQRCRADQCYLLRVQTRADDDARAPAQLAPPILTFWSDQRLLLERTVELGRVGGGAQGNEWLGWVCAPTAARMVQMQILPEQASQIARIDLHAVNDHDTKCHPLANVPHWDVYRRGRGITQLLAPEHCLSLSRHLPELKVQPLRASSIARLDQSPPECAIMLDDAACERMRLRYPDIARLAASRMLIVDLGTFARLVAKDGLRAIQTLVKEDNHGLTCARNVFAAGPTRGFALLDTFPLGALTQAGGFALRVIRHNRAWRALATELKFEVQLESCTADEEGDIVLASQRLGDGELMVSDIPLLAAAPDDSLIAPRLTRHLLRMLLDLPLPDAAQYWTRWEEVPVILRDIAELPRRYEPLRALRWAGGEQGLAELGISIAPAGPIREHVLVSTGRIDCAGRHDGLPPEPMMIFMKWLAREARQQSEWFVREFDGIAVTWIFQSAVGTEYVSQYPAADARLTSAPSRMVRLRSYSGAEQGNAHTIAIQAPAGVLGDGSLDFQSDFTRRVMEMIVRARPASSARRRASLIA